MNMDSPSKREARLVLRAQVGDRSALDDLLRGTQDWLFRYLLGLLKHRQLAEDALQDTMLLICRKLRWLNDPRCYRAWVYRIASRQAFRQIRANRSSPKSVPDVVQSAPSVGMYESALEDREVAGLLLRKIDRFSPNIRTVLVLHYSEELSLGTIAAILDLPAGTVKSRLAYGLNKLRTDMKEHKHE